MWAIYHRGEPIWTSDDKAYLVKLCAELNENFGKKYTVKMSREHK